MSSAEREWFNHLEAEVYLPIFSKREWIGLLATCRGQGEGFRFAARRTANADQPLVLQQPPAVADMACGTGTSADERLVPP